jgi:hypothetical protein
MRLLKKPFLPPGIKPGCCPGLPPWLITQFQLPAAEPSIFGGPTDGPGHSLVYYYILRQDCATSCDASQLAMLKRFMADGKEADGEPTRDRTKLIAQVANLDQVSNDKQVSVPKKVGLRC